MEHHNLHLDTLFQLLEISVKQNELTLRRCEALSAENEALRRTPAYDPKLQERLDLALADNGRTADELKELQQDFDKKVAKAQREVQLQLEAAIAENQSLAAERDAYRSLAEVSYNSGYEAGRVGESTAPLTPLADRCCAPDCRRAHDKDSPYCRHHRADGSLTIQRTFAEPENGGTAGKPLPKDSVNFGALKSPA